MNNASPPAGPVLSRAVVALLEAPKTIGGLECLRSLQVSFYVVFLTRNLLDYAKFDPEGLLGHVKAGNVIEVDTSKPLDVIGALQEWTAESGLPVAALTTHTTEHLEVCSKAAGFLGLWHPNMPRDAMEPDVPSIQGMPTDPWADQALNVNVLTVDGQHELIAVTGRARISKGALAMAEWELNLLCMGLARTALDACAHEEGPAHVQVVFTDIHATEGVGRPHATVVGVSRCFSDDLGQEAGAWRFSPDPFERATTIALDHPYQALLGAGLDAPEALRLPSRGFVAFGGSGPDRLMFRG